MEHEKGKHFMLSFRYWEKNTFPVTSEHCAHRVHPQSTDLHVLHTYKSSRGIF